MNLVSNPNIRHLQKFTFSGFESNYFNLRVFRSLNNDLPDASDLRDFCFTEKADLIRMKIDITHEEYINMTLFEAKFPFFYSHSVMTVFADYRYDSIPDYKNKFLSFERYSGGADKMRFRNLVLHGMGDDPIGYYKTPLINDFISKQKEAQCYADYYAQLYDGRHRDKIAFIMKKAGDDVGVFVFELQGKDTINTSMAAVLPAYRSSGLFHDMKVFRQRFCVESGITKAYAGFRLNNFNTPNSLLKIGYKIVMGEHVFHIAPLLNKQKSPSSY